MVNSSLFASPEVWSEEYFRHLAETFLTVHGVLIYRAKSGQARTDDSDRRLDIGPDGRVSIYPATVCEGDAADGNDADYAGYADAETLC